MEIKLNSPPLVMNEKTSNLTVVQGNDLLEGGYKISLDEFRLLNLALLQIDSMNEKPKTPYVISVSNFQEAYGVDKRHSHVKLREAARSLLRKPITLYRMDEKRGKLIGTERPWFSLIEYDAVDSAGSVKVYFSEFVTPYLYELKKNFTSVTFKYLAELTSPFSIRLYHWLSKGKKLRSNQSGAAIETILNVAWMKERSGLVGRYAEYKDFRRKVIEPAVEKINQVTDLSVMFKPVYDGKFVTDIKFIYINENDSSLTKPTRQRLPRRPRVKTGTHEEGVWARQCISIVCQYKKELEEAGMMLPMPDLKKMATWYGITGDKFAKDVVLQEIENRKSKK